MHVAATPALSAVLVIPTYNRTDNLRKCLMHVRQQSVTLSRVVVVDASPGDETRRVVESNFPEVLYLRNETGAGSTATSRRLGVEASESDIVAFLDDDAYPAVDWLEKLLDPYADAKVGAVGGRALNGVPGEESDGVDQIGRLLPDGRLTGNFAADPGRVIAVDHLLGANMSLRRSALTDVGGIRDYYPGTCLREETDPLLRIRAAGWGIVFTPFSTVIHVAGPYARGKRFDARYVYFTHRNHVVLLSSTRHTRHLRRYIVAAVREAGVELVTAGRRARANTSSPYTASRAAGRGLLRSGVTCAGLLAGGVAARRARAAEKRLATRRA